MDNCVMPTYARHDISFVDGRGAVLIDDQGHEFLDFLSGIAVNALGHAHPRLTSELQDQLARCVHVSNLFRHPYTEDVAQSLCRHTDMASVFFTNSGSEAVECAMKLARKAMHLRGEPARTSFVALQGAFHGRTLGALSLTHSERHRSPFQPLQPVTWVPAGDVAALEHELQGRNHAALVLEPIQGEGGIRVLPEPYLAAARKLCTETGTLLVHDEIQSGCGRTGKFLAAQHAGVTPDIVTLAKPIAAGLPMGACLANAELAGAFAKGEHGSTFAGGPLACRAAMVFLDELDQGLLEQVQQRGNQLRKGLEQLQGELPIVREVRGRGLMVGIQLAHSAPQVQQTLAEAGLLTNCTAGDVIRLLPPFVITREQVELGIQRIRSVLADLPHPPAGDLQ